MFYLVTCTLIQVGPGILPCTFYHDLGTGRPGQALTGSYYQSYGYLDKDTRYKVKSLGLVAYLDHDTRYKVKSLGLPGSKYKV